MSYYSYAELSFLVMAHLVAVAPLCSNRTAMTLKTQGCWLPPKHVFMIYLRLLVVTVFKLTTMLFATTPTVWRSTPLSVYAQKTISLRQICAIVLNMHKLFTSTTFHVFAT